MPQPVEGVANLELGPTFAPDRFSALFDASTDWAPLMDHVAAGIFDTPDAASAESEWAVPGRFGCVGVGSFSALRCSS
eukprot:10859843-Alexandrium_andersonii.AAC.1